MEYNGIENIYLNGTFVANVTTDKYGYAKYDVKNLPSGRYAVVFSP